jgi:hypothetical protein
MQRARNVPPGTLVNLVNTGETGPLQLTLGPGSYTITNAATTGTHSAPGGTLGTRLIPA